MTLEREAIDEKTPPMPIGTKRVAFEYKGFLGIGKYQIIHEVVESNSGWKDTYRREPPNKNHCHALKRCLKSIV